MSTGMRPVVAPDKIEAFDRDGLVLLEGMFDDHWIKELDRGVDENRRNPTPRARIWDRDSEGRTMFYDSQAWCDIDEYRQFVFGSPAAEIAAQLMGSSEINFFFDAVFERSPGTQFTTPWHQDEPYWTVEGYNTCSIWMPLVPVSAKHALAFVPGSHRKNRLLAQHNFGALNPDGETDVDQVDFTGAEAESFPDIDADPEGFGVISFDMQPGDCVAFNSRTMHGGSGKLPADAGLRVFTTKWLGDDVFIKFREHGMDPDHSAVMTERGLKPGERPGGDLYPRILPRR